ncbi:MAG: 4-hydroxy-tetrahydrodipicolinate synthase [Cyclobacteriaceae bacterium]
MSKQLRGLGVALVTPFNEKGGIDYGALSRLLEHVSGGGVDYLVALGTTAETPTLNSLEKRELVNFIKSNNPNNLPIVIGRGGNSTNDLINSLDDLKLDGIEALLSVTPYYNRPSQDGLIKHYMMLADACPVPVILYNVPSRTSCNLDASSTLRLAEYPNIIGIKEASGDLEQCATIAAHAPDDFLIISGEDMLTLPLMGYGGVGVISVLANALPNQFSKVVHDYLNGDSQSATAGFKELVTMTKLIFEQGNPTGIKEVLSCMGICENHVRLPLTTATELLSEKISLALSKL